MILRHMRGTSRASRRRPLASGQNLIITPGFYHLSKAIDVLKPGTIVLGLGLAGPAHAIAVSCSSSTTRRPR